jgi:long-subunit acyl-CoA synthetase (AMP-forming)
LRYITNTGGAMPLKVLAKLRELLPETRVFLMYGLTEAFRSTYLPPEEVDRRPTSIGKAIPNTEILVVGTVTFFELAYDDRRACQKLRRAGLVAKVAFRPSRGLGRQVERLRTRWARWGARRATRAGGPAR